MEAMIRRAARYAVVRQRFKLTPVQTVGIAAFPVIAFVASFTKL